MRITLLILLLISSIGYSQSNTKALNFNTKYYNAVDKWVVFPKKASDSTYTCGFVYIDVQAGFTFHHKSKFRVTKKGLKNSPENPDLKSVKYRLDQRTSKVSVLTKKQMAELGLPKKPKWLATYKGGSEKAEYQKRIGAHYNHAGASRLALEPLNKAYKLKPHYDGLEFELGFAYNTLQQFDKAITVLEKAIRKAPRNPSLYRELGYAYNYSKQIEKAENTYRKGISLSKSDFGKSEMAYNMTYSFFELKNRAKFDEWATLTRKYATEGSKYIWYLDLLKKKWDKK